MGNKYNNNYVPRIRLNDTERKAMVRAYYESGIGYMRFALMHGVSKSALSMWISKFGVEVKEDMKNGKLVSSPINKNMVEIPVSQYVTLKEIENKFVIMCSIMNS